MVLRTRTSSNLACKAKSVQQAVMAEDDCAELKPATPAKKRKTAVSSAEHVEERQQSMHDPQPHGSGTNSRSKLNKTAAATFTEDDAQVDFEVDAPAGEFLSDGDANSSESDSGEEECGEETPAGTPIQSSQERDEV